ncbi:hypothetical protein [Nocardioides sp. LHG3406-4]|uniref:hypothetical protein n=1 Tax=Nocardioides sp. LHG3406-4 TaxID=2804575 RepID=UPI003CEF1952
MDEVAWIEARTLDIDTTRETWALAARHVLADTAGDYHAVITVADLAEAVQQRTRIRTRHAASLWLGDVLYRVARACHGRGEPLLGALCVGPDGRMSDWYSDTVATVRGDAIADPEQHAAEERLDCYRFHGAELPPGGGVPSLPPRREPVRRAPDTSRATRSAAPAARRTTTARKPEPAPAPLCPTCFMVLPSTGVCDNCD